MKQEKYNDLPEGVEHISTILPRVLREIALKTLKSTVISAYCRGIVSQKTVEKAFKRLPGMKGA
jgi:hypothetical protein